MIDGAFMVAISFLMNTFKYTFTWHLINNLVHRGYLVFIFRSFDKYRFGFVWKLESFSMIT